MSSLKLLGALLLSAVPLAQAQATVWKCIGPDGRPQYTNVRSDTQGRNCTVVNREVSVVPSHRSETSRTAKPAQTFPKVDRETQRARDDARRQILEEELAAEQEQLAAARGALEEQESIRLGNERNYQKVLDRLKPYQDAVAQHERNVQALQQELGSLK